MTYIQKNSPLNELKAKVTKTDEGYTKRAGVSEGVLGIRKSKGYDKTDRKYTGEFVKSSIAQNAAQIGAYALGASGGAGVAIGLGAGVSRTAGNLIQQAVAKRREKKFGQAGSAIVPNAPSEYQGQNVEKAYVGEKTRTHKDAAAGRKSARNFRKAERGFAKYQKYSNRYAGR